MNSQANTQASAEVNHKKIRLQLLQRRLRNIRKELVAIDKELQSFGLRMDQATLLDRIEEAEYKTAIQLKREYDAGKY